MLIFTDADAYADKGSEHSFPDCFLLQKHYFQKSGNDSVLLAELGRRRKRVKDTCEKYGAYTTRWSSRGKSSDWKNQAKHSMKCKCSSTFDVESRFGHFMPISSAPMCIVHRWQKVTINIYRTKNLFQRESPFCLTKINSQGEGACKAETKHAEWLWPRSGDGWTDLESYQKVSSTDYRMSLSEII